MLTDAGVPWQIHALPRGLRRRNDRAVVRQRQHRRIDVGIGILSMHSPMELSAKVDIWELYRGFKAFWARVRPTPCVGACIPAA